MDPPYYEGTPLERDDLRHDDAIGTWARYEAKSEAMEAELRAQAGLCGVQAPALGSKLARVGAALAVYGVVAALVLGSLSLSLRSTSREPHDPSTLAGVDGGAERELRPRFGPFRP